MINFDEIKEVEIPNLKNGKGTTKANMFMDINIKII